jgi:hypothetical protein
MNDNQDEAIALIERASTNVLRDVLPHYFPSRTNSYDRMTKPSLLALAMKVLGSEDRQPFINDIRDEVETEEGRFLVARARART